MKEKLFILAFLCYSTILYSQNWYLYSVPRQRQLHDITFQPNGKIVVVGGNPFNDSICFFGYSNSLGIQWSVAHDIFQGKMQKTVLFTSDLSGISAGLNGSFFKTNDGGLSWMIDDFGIDLNNRNTNCLFNGNVNEIFAVGGLDNQNGFILKSTDNGNFWQTMYEWTDNEINSGAYIGTNKIAVCGSNGFIRVTNDNGLTWLNPIIENPSFSTALKDLVFVNEQIGVCVGGKSDEDSIALILRTIDGGLNWNIVYQEINPCLNAIEKVTDNLLYAAGDNGIILKSEDAGVTWTKQVIDINPSHDIYAIDFLNEHVGGFSGKWGKVIIFNDGYYDNIENMELIEVSFFPNPTSGNVYFSEELSNIKIINMQGKIITIIPDKSKVVSFSDYSKGTYFIVSDNYKTIKINVK